MFRRGRLNFRCRTFRRIATSLLLVLGCLVQVSDVLPRATEEGLVKADLVDVMADEAGGPPEDEDGVQDAALDVAVGLFPMK